MSRMNRQKYLAQLSDQAFDLIVIGGGITGAFVAYDAANRGLKVALVEKGDFGGETSAASSKILHGGIRYLQQGRLDKVRESAFERIYIQNLVPHLCKYLPFVIPAYRGLAKGRTALRAALLAYSFATLGQNKVARCRNNRVPPARMIGSAELNAKLPWLRRQSDVSGGIVLPECHMNNSERMTLALISGAVHFGAVVANYAQAEHMSRSSSTSSRVIVRDLDTCRTLEIQGKCVANCAGPWIGSVNKQLLGLARGPITGYSRGSHIIVEGMNLPCAVALPTGERIEGIANRGGRHMFLIPWRGMTLVGTSYSAFHGSLDDVVPTEQDIDQLISGINSVLNEEIISRRNVIHAYSGIYPLITDNIDESAYQGTGDYKIVDHYKTDGIAGYFSVFGAKYTTARLLAEKVCNQIVGRIGGSYRPCSTRTHPVPAASYDSYEDFSARLIEKYEPVISASSIRTVLASYGSDAPDVLDLVQIRPSLGKRFCDDRATIEAEVVYSAQFEMVCHLDDFIFRRSGLGTIGNPGEKVILRCAELLAEELGWSPARFEKEIGRTNEMFGLLPVFTTSAA